MQLKERATQRNTQWRVLTKIAVVIGISALSSYSFAETDASDLQLTIAFGDSLGALSLKHTGSVYNVEKIAAYNNILSTDALAIGDLISIPANLLEPPRETSAASATATVSPPVINNVEKSEPAARLPEFPGSNASEAGNDADALPPSTAQQPSEDAPQNPLAAVEEPAVEPTDAPKQDEEQQPKRAPASPPAGLFDVDEEAAKRALERSLSNDNAVLLGYGQAEIGFSYDYAYDESLSNFLIEQDGQVSVGTGRSRACFHGLNVTLRSGLPWDSQFEIGLPYKYNCATTDISVGSQFLESIKNNGSGSGDARFALLKTISNGANGGPSIVARVSASPGNGKSQDGDTSLGGGTATTSLGLQMSVRQDPMVYSLGLSATQFEKDDDNYQLGNQYSFSARTYLSTSPSNSISLGFSNTVSRRASVANVKTGPDGLTFSYLNLGFSSVLRNKNYVAIDLATGLNDTALDFSLSVLWTKRFSWSRLRK